MLLEIVVVGKLCEHMKGDEGETARYYIRSLSDAYMMIGAVDQSKALSASADSTRKGIQGDR
jgi:hypothetical protein